LTGNGLAANLGVRRYAFYAGLWSSFFAEFRRAKLPQENAFGFHFCCKPLSGNDLLQNGRYASYAFYARMRS
jgi:hypothetical protein